MEKFQKYLMLLLVATIGLTLSSCGGDDEDAPTSVTLSQRELQFPAYGGNAYITVKGGVPDYVEGSCDWVSTEIQGTQILVTVGENTGGRRAVSFIVQVDEIGLSFTVVQDASDNPGGGNQGDDTPGGEGVLAAPTNLKAWQEGIELHVTWDAVPGASGYELYYKTVGGSEFSVYTEKPERIFSSEYNVLYDDTYIFSVCAYKDGKRSERSGSVSVRYNKQGGGSGSGGTSSDKPSRPTGLRANVNGTQVTVSWNASAGASYYRLYYVKPAPYDIQSFDNVYSTSTTMNCTVKGTWTIWVEAVSSNYEISEPSSKVTFNVTSSGGGGQGGGDNPGGGSEKPSKLDTPRNLEYASDLYYVQISCDEVPLAYTYELYRSRSANSGYVRVTASGGSTASGRYVLTDQNPLSGTSYYKIKAKALSYLGIGDSDYSAYIKVTR